jgi:hypothetical protein
MRLRDGPATPRPWSPQRLADDLRAAAKFPGTKPKGRRSGAIFPLWRVCDEHVLGAAQNVKQAQRKAEAVPSQPVPIRGTVAGCGPRLREFRRVVTNPLRAPIRDADLRVGLVIRSAAALMAIILARGPCPGDDLVADREPLGLVTVEQAFRRGSLYAKRQLPREVVRRPGSSPGGRSAGGWAASPAIKTWPCR